jgi:maltose alpha-D-glucosyltransferase/alpha-amylase
MREHNSMLRFGFGAAKKWKYLRSKFAAKIFVLIFPVFFAVGFAVFGKKPDTSHVPVLDRSSALPKGWNQSANFMEIFVRAYKDSNGDGIGDLNGLTGELDYLKSLGITGLWLMPVGPSADHDHGYAQAGYRDIDPDYGTLEDFDTLLREAHKRGIGIILDFEINHSADTNPIFKEASSSPDSHYRNWYIFRDADPGWKAGCCTYPWRKAKDGPGYYYAIFDESMPDWNLSNPEVITYLKDTLRFWLNRGVDGFRFDAVTMLIQDGPDNYINNPRNARIVAEMAAVVNSYDNRYLICEASEMPEIYAGVCQHSFALGTQIYIRDSALKGNVEAGLISQLQSRWHDRMPLVLQTHDFYVGDRLIDQFGMNGAANYKIAAATAILASPTSFTYYGEEIGESNNGTYSDAGLRAPMSWTGNPATAGFTSGKPFRNPAINTASHNVAAEAGKPGSLLEFYRALYRVRRANSVLATGSFRLMSKAGDPSLVFSRSSGEDMAIIAINFSGTPQAVSVQTNIPMAQFSNALKDTAGSEAGEITASGGGSFDIVLPAKTVAVLTAKVAKYQGG